jgi:DNA polymerase kappa
VQFLQPNAGGPSSPRKRQKVGDDTTAETQSPGAGTATTPAKAPPPFFFADSDEEEEIQELPGTPDAATASARRPEPPRFFGDSDDDGDDALPALPALPEPAGAPPDAGSASDPDLEPAPPAPSQGGADTSCPVCGRELGAVDNAALNAHVDFCLSKGAIRAAQTRAPDASQEARLPARVRVSPAAPARAGGSSIAGFFTPRPAGVKELVRGGKKGKARA